MSRKGDLIQVDAGPAGIAGPPGPVTNQITIEGVLTFSNVTPTNSTIFFQKEILGKHNFVHFFLVVKNVESKIKKNLKP